jgi:hypothetical protein
MKVNKRNHFNYYKKEFLLILQHFFDFIDTNGLL